MTANDFRRLVLDLVDAVEGAHMGHPDFRVNGRVFASLYAAGATVKLTPEEQARLMADARGALAPASGAWGRQGWTSIDLATADAELVGEAATIAWQLTRAMKPVKPRRAAAGASETRTIDAKGAARRVTRRSAKTGATAADTMAVEAYIARCAPDVRSILTRIRSIVRRQAPLATERISYQMPAFFLDGALIYYAPFKQHIGMYPPVKGDAALQKALAKYRGEKGNLKFPLAEPMPYALIQQVVQARVADQSARAAAKQKKTTTEKKTTKRGHAGNARTAVASRRKTAVAVRKKARGRG